MTYNIQNSWVWRLFTQKNDVKPPMEYKPIVPNTDKPKQTVVTKEKSKHMTIEEILNLNDAEFIRYIDSCPKTYLIEGGRRGGKWIMQRRYLELLQQRVAEVSK